jgi:DNA replication ATP-dependent helicase Dna2
VPEDVQEASKPHVERLINFASSQKHTSTFRNETFVLAPKLGLKGRIDAVWEREGRPVIVCDLKTGRTFQGKPQEEYLLQVLAYAFMLVTRGENEPSKLWAILIYSGDANNLLHKIGLSTAWFRKVVDARNLLVRMEVTSNAPHATSIKRCYPCTSKLACRHIGMLCDHNDPRPIGQVRDMLPTGDPEVNEGAKAFFNHYASLLAEEFAAAKTAHAGLWAKSSKERCETGKSLYLDAEQMPEAKLHTEEGYYVYDLYTPSGQINTSILRSGDAVILSGPEGPKSGRTTIATVTESRVDGVQVRTREELLLSPAWADLYTDEGLAARMFSGLYRFVASNSTLLGILLGEKKVPTFTRQTSSKHLEVVDQDDFALNDRQRLAVGRSLQADTCLLVNGPPGAGKTSLIAAMVSVHLAEGSRILIATTTNRALDQALGKVSQKVGPDKWMRLGSALSASDEEMQSNTVAEIVKRGGLSAAQRALMDRPVVGGTISTLLSGSYDAALGEFDLVIIDEATQSTIPATLGAVSFGKRFVLIGDPNQLPPIAQAMDAMDDKPEADTDKSEWPALHVSLFEHIASLYKTSQPDVIVNLVEQYRMNDAICSIPSQMWYEPDLKLIPANLENAHGTQIAHARLACGDSWESLPMAHLLDPERPFVFVDVELPPVGAPRVNENEATLVIELLSSALRIGNIISPFDKTGRPGRDISIAVISPYRAQVARIRSMAADEHRQHVEVWRDSIDTVDRFQGSEADFVIISLSPYAGMSDTTEVSKHIANSRRLNVAMTRARHKLIMLGNRDYLAGSPVFQKLFKVAAKTLGEDRWIHRHYESVIP